MRNYDDFIACNKGNYGSGRKLAEIIIVVLMISFLPSAALRVNAENDIDNVYDDLYAAIPNEVSQYISDDISNTERYDFSYFLNFLKDTLDAVFCDCIGNMARVFGLVMISAVLSLIIGTYENDNTKPVLDFITSVCTVLPLYEIIKEVFSYTITNLKIVGVFSQKLLPVMTILYSAGGNISTASLNNTAMIIAIEILQKLCIEIIFPMLNTCFGIVLISSSVKSLKLSGISSFIRNTAGVILSFIMMLFCALLSFKCHLSESADGVALRTVRFAAQNSIPIVGSAVGEAVKTLGGSLSYIKGTVGFIAVVVILLVCLPPLVTLIVYNVGTNLAASVSESLGLDGLSTLLKEAKGLFGFCLAILTACSVMFIIIFTLFIKSGDAVTQ